MGDSDQLAASLDRFLRFVEWPRVLEAIADRTVSRAGSHFARELTPSLDPALVELRQARTAEASELLQSERAPELSGVADVEQIFGRADRLGRLPGPGELRAIARTLLTAVEARRAFASSPRLGELVAAGGEADEELADVALAEEVLARIGEHGAVLDDASERLAELRELVVVARHELKQALGRVIRDPSMMVALAHFGAVEHEGQQCLRVKRREVRRVPGPVLGEGRDDTVYVEPDEARAEYNRLRHLELDERAEEARIVRELGQRVLPRREVYQALAAGLIEADLHLALARYARDLDLARPALAPGLGLELREARHPLLAAEARCVPIDLTMGPERRMVVLSGPNGGGKTVAIKTVALAAALAQAGSFVPAAAGARLPLFRGLLSVSEAESSVSAGLSTFQAHAREMAAVAERCGPDSLVLLDEIGLGTDPGEAAALAQAFLEHLLAQDALTLVTTHLGPLKAFAERTPGVANAAVALDEQGHPTYRVAVGQAGRSYALEVARSAGVPAGICARAEALHRGH